MITSNNSIGAMTPRGRICDDPPNCLSRDRGDGGSVGRVGSVGSGPNQCVINFSTVRCSKTLVRHIDK